MPNASNLKGCDVLGKSVEQIPVMKLQPPRGQGRFSFREQSNMIDQALHERRTGSLPAKHKGAMVPFPEPELDRGLGGKKERPQVLTIRKRLYEFYVAPITTFWSFAISYLLFLILFTYVVLVRTPSVPQPAEIFVIVYVVSLGVEQLRKIFMSEPIGFRHKVRVFSQRVWNWSTSVAILMFLCGFSLRMVPEQVNYGRVIYCSNIIFWYLRILDLLSVNSKLGPYITMVGKMVMNMISIVTILTVVLMSFGVARQSILFPDQDWEWKLVRNIFYKPYFMLYGEVYAPEIDTCGDEGKGCVLGGWLTAIYMTAFLLVANILLINLLIAVFNNIFNEENAVAHQMWKFQRYQQVMEYEANPSLPPPLVLFCDIYLLLKFCCRRRRGRRNLRKSFDYSLKLFLNDDEREKLHDFEEASMEDLAREKEFRVRLSDPERLRRMADKVEFISMKLGDYFPKDTLKSSQVDVQLKQMQETQNKFMAEQTALFQTLMQELKIKSVKPPEEKWTERKAAGEERAEWAGGSRWLVPPTDLWSSPENVRRSPGGGSSTPMSPLSPAPFRARPSVRRSTGNARRRIPSRFTVSPVKGNESDSSLASPNLARHSRKRGFMETENTSSGTLEPPSELAERAKSVPLEHPPTDDSKVPLNPLASCPAVPKPSSPSLRYRRNGEYTSITDAITLPGADGYCEEPGPSSMKNLGEGEQALASSGLRRAKPSFVLRQNEMLREFEETSSRITGGLIGNRIRLESSSVCLTNREDLEDMGLSDLDVEDYLKCLQRQSTKSSSSSSLNSLSSARLEDEEGFQQINECLMQKEGDTSPTQTPLTSPGSKAAQIFTFDADHLQDYLDQVQPHSSHQD